MVRGVTVIAAATFVLAVVLFHWLGSTLTDVPGSAFNTGQNAVWLERTWVADAHGAADYDALAAVLAREQVRYVFVHAGVLTPIGALPAGSAPDAATLEQALHQRDTTIKVIAWIGQEERASGESADETISLADPAVRANIVKSARQLVGADGFDGVQYDIEPLVDGNASFLALLDATRPAIGAGKLLSVAAPMWAPSSRQAGALRRGAGSRHALWSTSYYAVVASRADQIAVMTYNTGAPFGSLYALAVKIQTQHVAAALAAAPHHAQVLIGLPTYHDNSFWFHDSAENMANGVTGVVAGLNSTRDHDNVVGVGVYRYGLTTAQDWRTYDADWLGDAH